MDAQLKTKWVKALRSGKYEQARYKLRIGKALCCIGVCHKVATGKMPRLERGTYPIAMALGIDDSQFTMLVDMNDYAEKSFPEIADYIEKNL